MGPVATDADGGSNGRARWRHGTAPSRRWPSRWWLEPAPGL